MSGDREGGRREDDELSILALSTCTHRASHSDYTHNIENMTFRAKECIGERQGI